MRFLAFRLGQQLTNSDSGIEAGEGVRWREIDWLRYGDSGSRFPRTEEPNDV